MSKTIAIIGGGASGLMCAISTKRHLEKINKSARVLVLEKNARVGKKLLATGNGKCNLANTNENTDAYHSNDTSAVASVLKAFDVRAISDFFSELGLCLVTANGTCVYPRSMQAASVLDVLRFEAQRLGVEFLCDFDVSSIKKSYKFYNIISKEKTISADSIVIASGSLASGGSDSGLALLKAFGHKIHQTFPALCALKCDSEYIKIAKGMRSDAAMSLVVDDMLIRKEKGEVLFCDYGLSGIAIMQLSGYVSRLCCDGKRHNMYITLDLADEYDADELYAMLKKRKEKLLHIELENFLCGFLNKRIAMAVIKYANIGAFSDTALSLTDEKLKKLCNALKNFKLDVTGTKGTQNAQVMGGGASLSDFYTDTLESKKSGGLFACGEVLDVYGDCGGYNLTWAWASGFVCGCGVAESIS